MKIKKGPRKGVPSLFIGVYLFKCHLFVNFQNNFERAFEQCAERVEKLVLKIIS